MFLKNFSPDKIEPIWNGPYKITEVDKNGNYVIIQENLKRTKQNIKNIRPLFGEGRISCNTISIGTSRKYFIQMFIRN